MTSVIAQAERKTGRCHSKDENEWKYIKFELQEFRDSGTYVQIGTDPIWDMLDDHIMKTMTIAFSPYIKFLYS
jgi:dynein heavy chain